MRKFLALLLAALLLVGVAPLFAQDATEEAPSGPAYYRVAHFAPDVPNARVFINGEVRFSGLRPRAVTRWIEVEPGAYEVAVGGSSNIANAAIGPLTVEFAAGDYVTIAAVGNADAGYQGVLIEEDFSEIEEGNARVTVFHGIPGVDPVDVRAGESVIVSALGFPGSFPTPLGPLNDGVVVLNVPAETYDLTVVPNGLAAPVLIDLTGTELEAGLNYLVAAVGTADAPGVVVVATDPAVDFQPEEDFAAPPAVTPAEPAATEEATEEASAGTLVDIALANEDFTTLVELVLAADPAVAAALSGEDELTVFAPTNDAFEAALEELDITVEDLTSDQEMLTQILLYHVVEGRVLAADLEDGQEITTLQGGILTVAIDGDTVTLTDERGRTVTVVATDVEASNGVIHVIDGVVLPAE